MKHRSRGEIPEDAQRVLAEVARYYLDTAVSRGFRLEGMTAEAFCGRILQAVINPAEIEDIVVLCETAALYRKRKRDETALKITADILETAIRRVVVG